MQTIHKVYEARKILETAATRQEQISITFDQVTTIDFPLHVDAYDHLVAVLRGFMREYVNGMDTVELQMRWLADIQFHLGGKNKVKDWFIRFESDSGYDIINPFMDELYSRQVDPYTYYGEAFTGSQWFSRFNIMMPNLERVAIAFIEYAIGDWVDVSYIDLLAMFMREACNDIVENDFIARDSMEVYDILILSDNYYWAMSMLFYLYEALNKESTFDEYIEGGLKLYKEVHTL